MHEPALSPPAEPRDPAFAAHQARRRAELWGLLGDLPPRREPRVLDCRVEERADCRVEHLVLQLQDLEPVPAWLVVPHRRRPRAGGLLYLHAHGGTYPLGKEELFRGRPGLAPYAPDLVALGLVTLAIDSWCFSGRQHQEDGKNGEWDAFKLTLWRGQVLWGLMLFDELQALTYLAGRPEVDPSRLGVLGMSMGATKAWWLAALDPRVRLCVDLCCLTDYDALIRAGNLRGHGIYYYVPGLLRHFGAPEINELIVPRPRLSLNGRDDDLTPPAGVERVRDHLQPLYVRHGRPDDCRVELFPCGHEETPAMRVESLAWLREHLA